MLQQLTQDYESCLQLDLTGEEITDKSLKRDIRKIQKVIKKLKRLNKRYNKILK